MIEHADASYEHDAILAGDLSDADVLAGDLGDADDRPGVSAQMAGSPHLHFLWSRHAVAAKSLRIRFSLVVKNIYFNFNFLP